MVMCANGVAVVNDPCDSSACHVDPDGKGGVCNP
jgi:hypothetical protein